MAVSVGTLTIDLRANTASFSQSMDKMSQLSAKTANDIKRSLERITVAGVAMATAIAGGTAGMIKHALDAADSMSKWAQAAGTTTETLSVLNYAAGLSNVATEDLVKGLEKLSMSALKAQNGNTQLAKVFSDKLHVSILDSNGQIKDSGILMEEVAVKFGHMGDSAGKTALAMSLFGKGGASLIPMLNQYGQEQERVNDEAHRFGLVLSSSTAEVAAKAHDNLDRLGFVMKGLGFSLLSTTLPALDKLLQKLIDIAANSNMQGLAQSFGDKVSSAVDALGKALDFAVTHATLLKHVLEGIIALQLGKIVIPVIGDLAAGGFSKLAEGGNRYALAVTGIGSAMRGLPEIIRKVGSSSTAYYEAAKGTTFLKIGLDSVKSSMAGVNTAFAAVRGLSIASVFTSIGSSLRAIPALLSTIASVAANAGKAMLLAALSNPWTIAIAAIIGLIALIIKFRDATFSLGDTTYKLRDTWNAAWIVMGKALSWIGGEFMKLVRGISSLWNSLMNTFAQSSIVKFLSKWFTDAFSWIGKMLGKMTPQFVIDALNQAKAEREAREKAGKGKTDATTPPKKTLGGGPDTSGLGPAKENPVDTALANLQEKLRASQETVAASGLEEAAQKKVNAANQANNEILKLGEQIAKQRGVQTKDFAKMVDEGTQAQIRSIYAQIADNEARTELNNTIGNATRASQLSIKQSYDMIDAMDRGADAVSKETALTQAWNELRTKGASLPQILARSEEVYNEALAKEAVNIHANIISMQQEASQRNLETNAILGNIDAQRQASLQAKLFILDQQIAGTAAGQHRDELLKQRQAVVDLTEAEWKQADAQNAAALQSPFEQYAKEEVLVKNAVSALASLQGGTLTYGQSLNIAGKMQDDFNRATDETISLLLRFGKAGDGVSAFFLEMQKNAITTGQIIFEALNSAFDKVTDNLTALITGGKADFGKMFEDIGKQMVKSTIQQNLQKGIGALGSALGIDMGSMGKKFDGSSPASALWVQFAGMSGLHGPLSMLGGLGKYGSFSTPPFLPPGSSKSGGYVNELGDLIKGTSSSDHSAGKGGGFLGMLGGIAKKLFKGGSSDDDDSGGGFGGLFGFLGNLIPHAAGGPVSPSSAYLVGEHGPEILTGASGNIFSNTDSRRMLNASTPNIFYSIDARGTDPALTEQRTRQAIIASHNSAVSTGVQVEAERVKRVPQLANGR
jgi:hypothetical protein